MSALQQLVLTAVPNVISFSRNWDDNLLTSQTLYGALSPSQSASGGQAHLKTGGAATAASSLDASPSVTDFVAQMNVSAYSAERTGLVYRTPKTSFNNNNWGFNFWAAVKSTAVAFGYGPTQIQEVMFPTAYTSGAIVLLQVAVTGTTHKVSVDGTLYINAVDSNHAPLEGIFGLMSILTANDSLYDNLAITA